MSGQKNSNVTTKSVLGFMFMPQFRLMAPAFSHLGPVFVRTLAVMFEQSGLIQRNHPATQVGLYEVKKFRIRDLLGEAWFNLRTEKGMGPHQYGMFIAVILMIVLMVASFFVAIFAFVGGFVGSAQAQLFNHPSTQDTSMATVPGTPPATMLFDTRDPMQAMQTLSAYRLTGTGAHEQYNKVYGDLAIDILNKTLRQAANGTGAPLQNALGPLLSTYSTAVMVIASVVIFWAILSIVVDTARTGQFGGGRHNMVWVPIRFVFAMGLMIPMASGFNTGQIMVLKLSEWGSNLGSWGWYNYVSSVANASLMAEISLQDPTEIVKSYVKANVCKVAVNTYLEAQMGTTGPALTNSKEYVTFFLRHQVPCNDGATVAARSAVNYRRGIGCTASADPIEGQSPGTFTDDVYALYENDQSETYCGGVIFPSFRSPKISIAGAPPSAAIDPIKFSKYTLRVAQLSGLVTVEAVVDDFACDFIRKHFTEGAGAELPSEACPAANIGNCSSNDIGMNDTGKMGAACIQSMIDDYSTAVQADIAANLTGPLTLYFTNTGAGSFIEKIRLQGWAGMGIWYHKISSINTAIAQAAVPDAKLVPPDVNKFFSGGISGIAGTLTGTGLRAKINNVLDSYDLWWSEMPALSPSPTVGGVGAGNPGAGPGGSRQHGSQSVETEGLRAFTKSSGGGSGKMKSIMNIMYPSKGYWMYDLRNYSGDATYPLAQLSKAGASMVNYALISYGITAVISIAAAVGSTKIMGFGATIGPAIQGTLGGPIGALIASISGFLMMGGLVLAYVVPILPWIRVTFAVLSWIMTVFEAVIMIPVVALAHLRTDGEGLMGPMTQGAYILWLNLILRPILTVCGFVAALLVFNSMVLYINSTLVDAVANIADKGGAGWADKLVYSVVYVGIIYVMANSVFKLVDIFPNATMKWIGGPQDNSFDDSAVEGMIVAGASAMQNIGSSTTRAGDGFGKSAKHKAKGGGASKTDG